MSFLDVAMVVIQRYCIGRCLIPWSELSLDGCSGLGSHLGVDMDLTKLIDSLILFDAFTENL